MAAHGKTRTTQSGENASTVPPGANQQLMAADDFDKSTVPASAAAVIVPPDSGWAWVVMVASFLCCTVIDGIVFCSALMQKSLIEEFQVSKGYIAFVSSLLSGCYLMAGPFVSALANRFGFRPVTIAGGFFAAGSFAISSYATSVEMLFFTYGILGGIGFCMIYIPAVVIIGFYFEKWRALATGLAMCGSGVGTIIFAPLSNYLLEAFGWRQTMLWQGAIIVSCVIFGIAFRPIQPITLAVSEDTAPEDEKLKLKLNIKSKTNGQNGSQHHHHHHHQYQQHKSQFTRNAFSKPLPEGRFAYSMPNSAHNTYIGSAPKNHYPTAAEVFKGMNLERRPSGASNKGIEMKNIRKSQPTTPNGTVEGNVMMISGSGTIGNTNTGNGSSAGPLGVISASQHQQMMNFNHHLNKELSTVGENEEETENENLLTPQTKVIVEPARRNTVSGRRSQDHGGRRSNVGSQEAITRPMYRDDIFFSGSLTRIPQYQSQTSLAYHMSVTRLPTKQEELEEQEKGCHLCPEAVRRTLSTMLDTSLLKSPSFMLLAFSGFLTMMGFFVPFAFLAPRAELAGMDSGAALAVISGIGLINTIGRVVCGSITSFPSVKPLILNNVAITAGGLATMFSGVIINTATQWTFAVLFGFCIACFSALRSLIAVEMIGLEKLTNAFGFLMLFQGIAATVGTPIAGKNHFRIMILHKIQYFFISF